MQLQEFSPVLADITPFQPFTSMTISSEVDAGYVSDRRQEVKKRLKEIEDTRKRFTEPLLESKRRIDDQAKQISAPLQAIVQVLDVKLIAWHQSQEQVRIEAEKARRAEEAARLEAQKHADLKAALISGDDAAIDGIMEIDKNLDRLQAKPIEVSNVTKTGSSTTYMRSRWTFEIEDAAQVPREYLIVDEVKLSRYATALKDSASVPGIRFYKKAVIGGR